MNDDKLMMSEELVGQVPELEDEEINKLINHLVLVSIEDGNTGLEIAGPAAAVLFSEEPELEIKMSIAAAVNVLVNKPRLNDIKSIKVLHEGVMASVEGDFYVDLAKILDINLDEQTCLLALGLKKNQADI